MVIWLDSARKQLQWRLIYATFDVNSVRFTGRACVVCKRSIPFGTEATTDESDAAPGATDAQSIDNDPETGTIEGESIIAQTSDARQYAHRRFNPETAGLPNDR
jgi:hypothetical protein